MDQGGCGWVDVKDIIPKKASIVFCYYLTGFVLPSIDSALEFGLPSNLCIDSSHNSKLYKTRMLSTRSDLGTKSWATLLRDESKSCS